MYCPAKEVVDFMFETLRVSLFIYAKHDNISACVLWRSKPLKWM